MKFGTGIRYRRKFRSQTSDNMGRLTAEMERVREKRKSRREKSRREKSRRTKVQRLLDLDAQYETLQQIIENPAGQDKARGYEGEDGERDAEGDIDDGGYLLRRVPSRNLPAMRTRTT